MNISDRLWTQNAGTRTPLASLGKFWDDKVGGDVNADEFLVTSQHATLYPR